ncbi:MAG: hypothetical protein WC373_01755 [Smithella sp.]|jgi:hypothetical protein
MNRIVLSGIVVLIAANGFLLSVMSHDFEPKMQTQFHVVIGLIALITIITIFTTGKKVKK